MKFSQNWSKYLEIMTPGKIASYYMLINFSLRTTFYCFSKCETDAYCAVMFFLAGRCTYC